MTATGHALVGASIAALVPNPALSLPLAFASHYVFDKLPHWDPMTNKADKSKDLILKETVLDVLIGYFLVGIIFVLILNTANPTLVFLSAFVAQLPDWLEAPYSLFKMKVSPFYEDYRVQKYVHDLWFNSRMQAPGGILTQVIIVGIFLALVFSKVTF